MCSWDGRLGNGSRAIHRGFEKSMKHGVSDAWMGYSHGVDYNGQRVRYRWVVGMAFILSRREWQAWVSGCRSCRGQEFRGCCYMDFLSKPCFVVETLK